MHVAQNSEFKALNTTMTPEEERSVQSRKKYVQS